MRDHYLDSPKGRIDQYASRWGRRLRIHLDIEPKSKKAMKLREKISFQNQILQKLRELGRRPFRGKVAATIELSATEPTPPHLYAAIKNLLDLFGPPLDHKIRRKGLVYYDDSQIYMLSVRYNVRAETPRINATFSPLGDFIEDVILADELSYGNLPEAESLTNEEEMEASTADDAIDSYFRLEREGLPVNSNILKRLLLYQQRKAQEVLLSQSRLSIRDLRGLYAETGVLKHGHLSHPALIEAIAESNRWFQRSPIRINLPRPPQKKGDTEIFHASIEQSLEKFRQRWGKILQPLLTPVALEVAFKPPPGSSEPTRDLDNLMKTVLARFNEKMKPPANYLKAFEEGDPEGARKNPELLPPKSLLYSVVRMDVFHLPRSADDQSDGFLVLGIAADMIGYGGVWQRSEELIDRWKELYRDRI